MTTRPLWCSKLFARLGLQNLLREAGLLLMSSRDVSETLLLLAIRSRCPAGLLQLRCRYLLRLLRLWLRSLIPLESSECRWNSLLLLLLGYDRRRIKDLRGDFNLPLADALQLISDQIIVWLVRVIEAFYVIENAPHFGYVFCHNPQLFLWMGEAVVLDIFYFVHRVFLLFSPLKLFIQKI